MTLKSLIFCAVGIPLWTACVQISPVPLAESFPEATLRKAKSAEHWNVIAADVSAQTAGLKDWPDIQKKPLYVTPLADNSDFSRAFHSLLISKLVNSGMTVSVRPEGAIEVKYETQVVRHAAGHVGYAPGTLTALSGGVLVARQISNSGASSGAKAAVAVAAIAGAEILAGNAIALSPTNTEVIITTSLVDNNRFLMRKSDVYYVEDAEGSMFEGRSRPQTKVMGVVGQ